MKDSYNDTHTFHREFALELKLVLLYQKKIQEFALLDQFIDYSPKSALW